MAIPLPHRPAQVQRVRVLAAHQRGYAVTNRERALRHLLPNYDECPPHPHELKRFKHEIDALTLAIAAARREAFESATRELRMMGDGVGARIIEQLAAKEDAPKRTTSDAEIIEAMTRAYTDEG